jgi:hypothetical protein
MRFCIILARKNLLLTSGGVRSVPFIAIMKEELVRVIFFFVFSLLVLILLDFNHKLHIFVSA